jgi:hypothetical protein
VGGQRDLGIEVTSHELSERKVWWRRMDGWVEFKWDGKAENTRWGINRI